MILLMIVIGQQQQQPEADIERLTRVNADLLTRLQCCEQELKEVTECEFSW